jgi:cell division protease FtsH
MPRGDKTMSRNENRVLHYLLSRQYRAARHDVFERAGEAGILERKFIGDTMRSGHTWRIAEDCTVQFTGDENHDLKLVESVMKTTAFRSNLSTSLNYEDEYSDGDIIEADQADIEPKQLADLAHDDVIQITQQDNKFAKQQRHALSVVKKLSPPLKPEKVATALLLARAINNDEHKFEHLMSAMAEKNFIVAIQIPAHDFVRQFGLMLEDGLILPFYTSLSSIMPGPSLSGRHSSLADTRPRKSIECMSGIYARRIDHDDELRQIISKHVLTQIKPVLIADEDKEPLPARLMVVADVTIIGAGIDNELIADVLAICYDIPVAKSLSLMAEGGLNPLHLGIDDIAVAIRPGRSLTRILGTLMALEADHVARLGDVDDDVGKSGTRGYLGGYKNSVQPSKSKKYEDCFDVITPAQVEVVGTKVRKSHLFIETLSGYGEAQQWALDLKQDLDAWQSNSVHWSDLSTRLLLSGPPGTGKTTYAKALCNSIQVPLVATSVARWLEPSNLGEVLTAISTTFKYVSEHNPCILFIDEIDNIGNRNGSSDGQGSDYWSSLINRLLELLDGATKTEGVIVLGATNRPDKIDPALLRSGRLEKHIIIPPPDIDALIGIIAHHLGPDLDAILLDSASVSHNDDEIRSVDIPDVATTNSAIHTDSLAIDDINVQSKTLQNGSPTHD